MSTRAERMSDRAQSERNTKILKELMARPDNRNCADCKKKDPRWASWNLGIFVCIRCSGHHRSLGTHISKVKSADLDSWTEEQIANMMRWGNGKANQYWAHDLPANFTPPESGIDHFIRSKYERKQYAMKGPIPDPDTLPLPEGVQNIVPAAIKPSSPPMARLSKPGATSAPQAQFANFAAAPPPAPTPTPASAPTPAPTPSVAQQLFDVFQSPPVSQQPQPQQQQGDFKTSILSLYGKSGSTTAVPSVGPTSPALGNFAAFPLQQQQQPIPTSNAFAAFPPAGSSNAPLMQPQSGPAPQQPLGAQFFGASAAPKQTNVGGIPDFAGFSLAPLDPTNGVQSGQSNLGHAASDDWGAFQ